MSNRRIRRLPKWAELAFEGQCAATGAYAHPPEEDQNGWDYFIEFEPKAISGPADTHPPIKTAYAQIKSTRKAKLTCRISLSNALKAAQSLQPWFFILIVAQERRPVKTYAIHVWEELIRHTLKSVRMAENAGKALNHCTITIRFDHADERDEDLVAWMQKTIETQDPDYEEKKKKIYQTVGYEDSYGVGEVTISYTEFDEMAKNFLGLGDGLALSQFSFTPSRFGIASPKPQVKTGPGKLHIAPKPVGTCEIRLRALNESYVLPGQFFLLNFPGLPLEQRRLRFSADFLEIITSPKLETHSFTAQLDPSAKKPITTLEAFVGFKEWCQAGISIDTQIWSGGKRLTAGTIRSNQPNETPFDWSRLGGALRALRVIADSTREIDVQLSLNDVIKSGRALAVFHEVNNAPSLRIETPLEAQPSVQVTSLVFYSRVEVGDFIFYSLSECPVRDDIVTDVHRQMTFEAPKRVDAYVIRKADEQDHMMERDYQRHLERLGKEGEAFGVGDILAFSCTNQDAKPNSTISS